ncbi:MULTISPECIES: UDP-glucose 4-epimerase GalE [Pseudidiomarina]|uniref:UDP-glucose 4-epimerase n=1 Tax=Pseudidiomarina homiensis TaxID=364198 RepID=A0A432Y5G8_9GAMM|nr:MULTISPECIES: UDP-glucose 4-epimerase GalE [Pseudidiomarina]RUO56220.1 UDP-glucose 4-epimerase GalE [Pseudidiomarina homiensis]
MILVTGGAGYIGSHTVVELLSRGSEVVVLDNFCNSSQDNLCRIEKITDRKLVSITGDVCDSELLNQVFSQYHIEAVIHFAGLKGIADSLQNPLQYYENNFVGTLKLCQAMAKHGVKKLVFSSSATVYGEPQSVPLKESSPTGATTNPYGASKYMVEQLLADLCDADPEWAAIALRYFNPVGAHQSGLIGETFSAASTNIMPQIVQAASGKLQRVPIYGGDYPTADGTGVRDYIHVVDLAKGHLAALQGLESRGYDVVNLGTGVGVSVLQMIKAFEAASGRTVPYEVVARRPGDTAQCYADPTYATERLGWRASYSLDDMMRDTWNWQLRNLRDHKSDDTESHRS